MPRKKAASEARPATLLQPGERHLTISIRQAENLLALQQIRDQMAVQVNAVAWVPSWIAWLLGRKARIKELEVRDRHLGLYLGAILDGYDIAVAQVVRVGEHKHKDKRTLVVIVPEPPSEQQGEKGEEKEA